MKRNKIISEYRKRYFQFIELLIDDGELVERGSWVKKKGSGRHRRVVSYNGYNKCEWMKWCWLRYYDWEFGNKLLGLHYEYIITINNNKVYQNVDNRYSYFEFNRVLEKRNKKLNYWYFKYWNYVIKDVTKKSNNKIIRVIDCNDISKILHFNLSYNRSNKKYYYGIVDNTFQREFYDGNKEKYEVFEEEKLIEFLEVRNELINQLDEWYDMSSNWIHNKKDLKKLKETNYEEFLELLLFWGFEYNWKKGVLVDTYNNFRKKIYSGYCSWKDYDNMKSHYIINYRNKNRLEELHNRFIEYENNMLDKLRG